MRWGIVLVLGCALAGTPVVSIAAEAMVSQTDVAPVQITDAVPASRSLRDLTKILRSPDRLAELEGAVAELQTMIDAGDVEAAFLLGMEYTKDRGTLPLDYAKGTAYLERAAALGMSQAYLTLAEWHRRELGGLSAPKALTYLQSAADAGLTEALVPLADAYRKGTYGEPDLALAIKYLTQVADAGDVGAAKQLAAIYRAGTGSSEDGPLLAKYLGIAAAGGDTVAMRSLADLYLKGEVVPQDLATAEQHLRAALAAGDGNAGITLGKALLRGQLGGAREAEGVALLQAAYDGGALDQASTLADAYIEGRGVPIDVAKGLGILQAGSEAGDAAANAALLNLYVRGAGRTLAPNLVAARSLYQGISEEQRTGAIAANGALLAAYGQGSSEFPGMWSLFAKLDATLKARTGVLLLRINKNAYVYVLQGLMTERGHYSGGLTGMLTSSTISAVNRFCAELEITEQCRFGPLARSTWDAIAANGLTS